MPTPSKLLQLPKELLNSILVLLAVDDLRSLARVAASCKALFELLKDEGGVWKDIHLQLYDDPRKACAFLAPRESFDWRQRVIDRDFVTRLLPQLEVPPKKMYWDEPPHHQEPILAKEAPRIFETALSFYLDLPAAGTPSANVPVLEDIIAQPIFPFLCTDTGRADPRANQLEALFTHVHDNFRGHSYDRNHFRYYDHTVKRPSPTCVHWFDVAGETSDVVGLAKYGLEPKQGELRCAAEFEEATRGGIDAVRSRGLLGLKSMAPPDSDEVWDWAGVRGDWFGLQALPRDRGPDVSNTDGWIDEQFCPFLSSEGYFTLTPARNEADVDEAWRTFEPGHRPCDLWEAFEPKDPQLNPFDPPLAAYDNALPPIYFHGYDRDSTAFIYGRVNLTNDNPPQLRWKLATRPRRGHKTLVFEQEEEYCHAIQGVQVGGCGARRGVIGTWGPFGDEYGFQLGVIWFWKLDSGASKP